MSTHALPDDMPFIVLHPRAPIADHNFRSAKHLEKAHGRV
jgi:hypothetical protein